CNLF
ncbi:adenosine deaminase, partial [Vibrio parahaemolyticus V-223/04]